MKAEPRDEFRRLLRFMSSEGARFGLTVARYGYSEVGRALQVSAIEEAKDKGQKVGLLDLSKASKDVDLLAKIARVREVSVVFVVGMESLLFGDEGELELSAAIAGLNHRRDLLPQKLHVRVVFWLSGKAASAFAELARDTYDVVLAIFEFDDSEEEASSRENVEGMGEAEKLEDQRHMLEELHARAEPSSISAADIALSLAKLESSLGRPEHGLSWLERAAQAYEKCGDNVLAAKTRERRARVLGRYGNQNVARTRSLVELLETIPSAQDDELAMRQLAALRALIRDRPYALVGLGGLLERHPATLVREWWRTRGLGPQS